MEDQQVATQPADDVLQAMVLQGVEECLADPEAPAGEFDLGLAVALDVGDPVREVVHQMPRIGRCADGGDAPDLRNPVGRGQHRRTAERMADQNGRRLSLAAHPVGRRHQVVDVRGEAGIGELAVAVPETGEVESQHRDVALGQPRGDPPGRRQVLRAGETMGEQGKSADRAERPVEPGGEAIPQCPGEVDTLGAHGHGRLHVLVGWGGYLTHGGRG